MENNIDKLFKSKLGDNSTPYDPAAWGRMAALIDEDDEINGNPPKKNRWKRYLGLALLLIVSLIGFWQFSATSSSNIAMGTSTVNDKDSWSQLNSEPSLIELSKDNSITQGTNTKSNNKYSNNKPNNHQFPAKKIQESKLEKTSINNQENIKLNQNNYREEGQVLREDIFNNNSNSYQNEIGDDKNIIASKGKYSEKNIKNNINQNKDYKIETNNTKSNDISPEIMNYSSNDIFNTNTDNNINTKNSNPSQLNISESNIKDEKQVLNFPFLETSSGTLESDYKEIVPLMTQMDEKSNVSLGLFSTYAFNSGYISQSGISIDYSLKSDWSLLSGLGIEYRKYNNGPIITVQDKLYSFGSTLVDRNLTMDKRTAITLPMQLRRSFNNLSVYGGFLFNYHLAGNGNIDNGEGNLESVWVTNDVFKPLNISYQFGASYLIRRRFELNLGLQYRTNVISSTVESQNSDSKIYPSIGFNYLIAKI